MTSKCRTCGAPIYWCDTENGGRMPVDASASEEGTLEVTQRKGTKPGYLGRIALACTFVPAGERAGLKLHTSHFTTCVGAPRHRKEKK